MLDIDPETARKNLIFGWALFGVFLLLFGGTVAVAFIYLWVAG
jgi:nitrogen fixation protein FixH